MPGDTMPQRNKKETDNGGHLRLTLSSMNVDTHTSHMHTSRHAKHTHTHTHNLQI